MRMVVDVSVTVTVAVDGADFNEGCELASMHALRVLAADGLSSADVFDVVVHQEPPPPEMKTVTYTCTACNKTSLKVNYGPGWIKCPHCGGVGTGITSS